MIKYQKEFENNFISLDKNKSLDYYIQTMYRTEQQTSNLTTWTTWGFDDERSATYIRLLSPKLVTWNYYFQLCVITNFRYRKLPYLAVVYISYYHQFQWPRITKFSYCLYLVLSPIFVTEIYYIWTLVWQY